MKAKPLGPSNQVIISVTRAQANAILWHLSPRYRAKLSTPHHRTGEKLKQRGYLFARGDTWNRRYGVTPAGKLLLELIRSLRVHSTDHQI